MHKAFRDKPALEEQVNPGRSRSRARLLIRASSILFGALTLGHLSAYPWSSANVPSQAVLTSRMKTASFGFMGQTSTYWNLYFGWGVLVAVLMFAIAGIVWLLAEMVPTASSTLAKLTGLTAATSLIGAYLSWRFFFLPPCLMFLVICILLTGATLTLIIQSDAQSMGHSST